MNLFTCEEKFYINFKMEERHKGIEQIYIKNSELDKKRFPSTFEGKETTITLLERNFSIKDDYNEKGSLDKIGTTITNLLNKSENLLKLLQVQLSIFKKINTDKIDELCSKVEVLINKFGLKEYDTKRILDTLAQLTNFLTLFKINENDELLRYEIKTELEKLQNSEIFGILYDFCQELYLLKKEYVIDEIELNMLVEKLLTEDKDIEDFFSYHISLRIVKELIKKLKHSLNKPLQYLLVQSFRDFYDDYKVVENKQRLEDFLEISRQNYNRNAYNTYYKKISEYMDNLNNQFIEEMKEYKRNHKAEKVVPIKFLKFSYQDMAIIFLQSFIDDLKFMNDNYDKKLEFTYINMVNKTENEFEFQISSWRELFYISNHYILEEKHKLRKCKLCGKLFIAEKLNRDKNCQRKYKKYGKSCREYADKNFREYRKSIDQIGIRICKIDNILKELLETKKIDKFNETKNKCQFIQSDDNLTEEEKIEKLTKIYNQLKRKK